MSMTDPLGDMLTRIRNGQRAGKRVIAAPASKLRARVLDVLQREGFIRGYSEAEIGPGSSRTEDRAEVSRGRAGDPRNQPRVQAGPAGVFQARGHSRVCTTASASPSCRRRAA